jgi:hypothetical protein
VSVSDTISLALGLVSIILSIINLYVTRKQRVINSKLPSFFAELKNNKSLADLDVENPSTQNIVIPNAEAPHEVVGDFLTSLARVVNLRKRNT